MIGSTTPDPLPREFFARPAEVVARELLGTILVSYRDGRLASGRIVETEAYIGPHDPASHAAERIGRTARNASMFGPPGTAYVYRIYGVHWCLNAVTDREGYPAAVLIRAIEPTGGLEVMLERRGWPGMAPETRATASNGAGTSLAPSRARIIAGGPGRLAQALGITGELDGHPFTESPLMILPGDRVPDEEVACGPRIGVRHAADWPLRFFVRDCVYVSR